MNYIRVWHDKYVCRSLIQNMFGQWLTAQTWEEVFVNTSDLSLMYTRLIDTIKTHLDLHLPSREVKVSSTDKPWVTPFIKSLIRDRQKAFKKGNDTLWRHLRNKVAEAISVAKKNYYNRPTRIKKEKLNNPSAWYRHIKIFTNGNKDHTPIMIPGIDVESTQYSKQAANAINDFFVSIASDLSPLDRTSLPAFLPSQCESPEVSCWEVYCKLRKLQLHKASIRDDLPIRIIREFACELSVPFTRILNMSFRLGVVPIQWKFGQVTPIPKSHPPCINNLRPITLTSYFSKVAESFMAKWLLEDIEKHIDTHQFGNRPGLSTSHYLVGLLHHLYKNAENSSSVSTIVCTDFKKAFDRLDHNILINKMVRMHIKPWIINWIISFLECRTQNTCYNGTLSDIKVNHAGVPQGTRLGPILFLIMVNDLCENLPIHYFKYVDDLSLVQCRKSMNVSQLQPSLNYVQHWSLANNMSLNPSKCFTLQFTFMKIPPPPEIIFINNSVLINLPSAKILGVIIQSDLKWNLHVNHLVKRCNRKLYMLRKLKKFNLPLKDLVLIYTGYIRPILEYCAPVFHSGLTLEQRNSLEKIQRRVCRIILGQHFISYSNACQVCDLPTLEDRRLALCIIYLHYICI